MNGKKQATVFSENSQINASDKHCSSRRPTRYLNLLWKDLL